MNWVSLFSGIGGPDLAAQWAGMETILFCEREPFAQKVLRKHWPNVPIIDDVHDVTREELDRLGIGTIDALSAGFPCQPFSHAGKREGTDDERYLWPQVVRVLKELQPTWFIGENVAGLLSMAEPDGAAQLESRIVLPGEEEDLYEALFTQQEKMLFGNICKDLEDIGYEVQPFVIPAAAVGAKNLRERVFILGYSERGRLGGESRRRAGEKFADGHRRMESGVVADSTSEGLSIREQTGQSLDAEEIRTRMVTELERCGPLANSESERFGKAWERVNERSASRSAGGGPETMADTESRGRISRGTEQQGQQGETSTVGSGSLGKRKRSTGGSNCSCPVCSNYRNYTQAMVNADGQRREEFNSPREPRAETTIGRSINPARGDGPTQSGMGRDPNVFSSWLDGSGLNPLDALIEFIATYPQPALLGQAQHNWEPPRVAVGVKDRAPRLKALGNAVNPLQIYPIMYAIKVIDDWLRRE